MIERMEEFEAYLKRGNLSESTVKAYSYAVKQYDSRYSKITKGYLRKYKLFLLENYKPKTVNGKPFNVVRKSLLGIFRKVCYTGWV